MEYLLINAEFLNRLQKLDVLMLLLNIKMQFETIQFYKCGHEIKDLKLKHHGRVFSSI